MSLFNIIKNNLFIQNFVATIVSLIPVYFEFSVSKYLAIKKAMFITAYDKTHGSYLEFGVFTGSSFNFAMKVNKQIEKYGLGKMDCEFIGFDSFKSQSIITTLTLSMFRSFVVLFSIVSL